MEASGSGRTSRGPSRGGLLGKRGFSQDFTFPGALAAAGWGLPGLGGTGKSREQGHVSAYHHYCLPELPRGVAGQDGAAALSTLGDEVRPPDLPKWRWGPVAAEGRKAQCWGCCGRPAFSRSPRILRLPPPLRGLEEGTAGERGGDGVSQSQPFLPHHPVFAHGVHWEATPEQRLLEPGMLSCIKENVLRNGASFLLVSTVCLNAHLARQPVSNTSSEGLGKK